VDGFRTELAFESLLNDVVPHFPIAGRSKLALQRAERLETPYLNGTDL